MVVHCDSISDLVSHIASNFYFWGNRWNCGYGF